MNQKTFYIILLTGFLCIMTLMSFASTDTTYITKDSVLVLKTINIELYKERLQNPNSFDKLYIYQRKDKFGYYKEFVFYKKLKN